MEDISNINTWNVCEYIINEINIYLKNNFINVNKENSKLPEERNLYIYENFEKFIENETNLKLLKDKNYVKYVKIIRNLYVKNNKKYRYLKNKLEIIMEKYGKKVKLKVNVIEKEIERLENVCKNKYMTQKKTNIKQKILYLCMMRKILMKMKRIEQNYCNVEYLYKNNGKDKGTKNEENLSELIVAFINYMKSKININEYELIYINNLYVNNNTIFEIENYDEMVNEININLFINKQKNVKGEIDGIIILKEKKSKIGYILKMFEYKSSIESIYNDYNKYYLLLYVLNNGYINYKFNQYDIKTLNMKYIEASKEKKHNYLNVHYLVNYMDNDKKLIVNKFKLIDFLDITKMYFFNELKSDRENAIRKRYNKLIENQEYIERKYNIICEFIGLENKEITGILVKK